MYMNFEDQLRDFSKQIKFKASFGELRPFKNIVISGMGGSGIAGSIFSEIYDRAPVQVVSDYALPSYADRETLFVGISYSGNTEETVAATKEAMKRGCQVRVITSGGELSELGAETVIVPKGYQPRAALGYLIKPFLSAFVTSDDAQYDRISILLAEMDANNSSEREIAGKIFDRKSIPYILGYTPFRWVAYRWKTQFNENSKILAFSSYFPELDHNDAIPFKHTYGKDNFAFLVFGGSTGQIEKRVRFTSEVTSTEFIMVQPKGQTVLEKLFYLVHAGDYISYHLGNMRNIDPEDVSVITELKNKLKS